MKRSFLAAVLAISASAPAAADSIAERMRACASETNEAERLACYDAAFAESDAAAARDQAAAAEKAADDAAAAAVSSTTIAAEAASDAAAATEAAAASSAADAAEEAAASAAVQVAVAEEAAVQAEAEATMAATDATAAAERAAAEDAFGMNRDLMKERPDLQEEKAKELRELEALVTEVRHRPGGEHIVTIENGQVWVEKRAIYGFRVEVGDTVLLKKGSFGGYKMVGRGRRSSEVRRVE